MSRSIKTSLLLFTGLVALAVLVVTLSIAFVTFLHEAERQRGETARNTLSLVRDAIEEKYSSLLSYEREMAETGKEILRTSSLMVAGGVRAIRGLAGADPEAQERARLAALDWVARQDGGKGVRLFVYDFALRGLAHGDPAMKGRSWKGFLNLKGRDALALAAGEEGGQGVRFEVFRVPGRDRQTSPLLLGAFVRIPEWGWVAGASLELESMEAEKTERIERYGRELAETLSQVRYGKSGYVFLFDRSRRMIVHPTRAGRPAGGFMNTLTGRPLLDDIMAAAETPDGVLDYLWTGDDRDGPVRKQAFVRLFKPLGWYYGFTMSRDEVLNPVRGYVALELTGLGAVLAAVCGLMFLYARRIVRPVQDLTSCTRELAEGEFSASDETLARLERIRTEQDNEIGTLAAGYVTMLRALERFVRNQKDLNQSLEMLVAERTRELEAAMHRAEEASRAKSEFLANMSHEVRTPLNGVMGMLQVMRDATADPAIRKQAELALSAGRSLIQILGDILDISRIEAGKLELVLAPFDPSRLLRSTLELFAPAVRDRDVRLDCEIGPGVPPAVTGDEVRIRQVLFNLVANAVKFTERGSVSVRLRAAGPDGDGDGIRLDFRVTDTGVGIPPSLLEAIFDPFTQGDGSYSKKYQGVGLGLAIAKRLTRLMGGDIGVESEPGRGASFFFSVRVLPAPEAATAQAGGEEAAGCGPQPRPLRILLVEDECINRMAAKSMLQGEGHTVTEAENGEQALAWLASDRFDLVLMDIQMPVMNGLEATRLIRAADPAWLDTRVPIVAMTAYAMAGDRRKFLENGVDGYISKPVELEELRRVLAQAMEGRGGEQAQPAGPASS